MASTTVISLPIHQPPTSSQMEELLTLQRSLLQSIATAEELQNILDDLCRMVENMVPDSVSSIMLLDDQRGVLNVLAAPKIPEGASLALNGVVPEEGRGSCAHAVLTAAPVFVNDTFADIRWSENQAFAEQFNIRACWSVPILNEQSKPVGTFAISSFEKREPTGFHMRLLQAASYLAGIALQADETRRKLHESEIRLINIADAVPGVLFQQLETPEGDSRFTFISQRVNELFGQEAGSVLENADVLWTHVDRQDVHGIAQKMQTPASVKPLRECEFRLHLNGKESWIYGRSVATEKDAEGNVIWNGIFLDITDKQLAHSRLNMAGMVFENTQEGIMVTDEDSRIIEVNKAFTRITGYEADDVLGGEPSILDSGKHGPEFYQAIRASIDERGYWEGEMWNRRKDGEVFPEWLSITRVTDPVTGKVKKLRVFSDISHLKRSEERLAHLAHHDPLTGLPNRLMLSARMEHALERAKRESNYLGVLFLDLDRFKNINDTLGHALGDEVLKQVAERLKDSVRAEDTVARLGGDEFIVLLEKVHTPELTTHIAEKLLRTLARPYILNEQEYYFTTSIGISHYPVDGIDAESLLKNSDTALYQAKDQGRNTYINYSPELTQKVEDWLKLEHHLRLALEKQQFEIYYQPKISTRDGKILGAEALLRWAHPELGLIPPSQFLTIAEEIGLIVPLGEWVLRESCRQARLWQEQGFEDLTISVNLAGQQIGHSNLYESIVTVLDETGLSPKNLELEILESFVMRHAEQSINTLAAIRDLGVSLSIDDFGSGYSSLSYLKRLPVSKLKIDQTLVLDIPDDPDDVAIARAVIALGHSMGLKVCAEGVETTAQREFLAAEGVDELQGYYYSRPVTADEFIEYIRSSG
jgi:diguanylate cyclase (GGDEF)-like protein/PAS domain S-box-containing protein